MKIKNILTLLIIVIIIALNLLIPKTVEATNNSKISFRGKFFPSSNGIMPYALFTPSTADESGDIPLIVWLHGSGELSYNVGESGFMKAGLPAVLNNWSLEGVNAYILCPQNNREWNNGTAANKLKAVMDMIIENYNIDTDQIILVGHSMGGRGALYMAQQMPEYFKKLVVLSGYNPGVNISEINIPTIGYVGTTAAGEDSNSVGYMRNSFEPVFGSENTFFLNTWHGNVPAAAFNEDSGEHVRNWTAMDVLT